MTPEEFRHELKRLYTNAAEKGLLSDDLVAAAKCSRHTMVKWIGGYACPATPKARSSVITAIAQRMEKS